MTAIFIDHKKAYILHTAMEAGKKNPYIWGSDLYKVETIDEDDEFWHVAQTTE